MAAGILCSSTFLKAYDRRRHDEQLLDAIDECIVRLRTNPDHPGLNTEHLFTCRGVNVYSARVNIQFRLIFAWPLPEEMTLLYVDNHDEAYDWAQQSRDHLDRVIEKSREWMGRPSRAKPANLPRLDDDEPVPIAGIQALREMLAGGMQRYLAYLDSTQLSYATYDFQERSGLMFIRGGAGTGKTAIAVHRALHLARQPELDRERVQYLCYNTVLAETVRETVGAICGGSPPKNLHIATFHSWCNSYLNSRGNHVSKPLENALAHLVNLSIGNNGLREALAGLQIREVVSEIGVIKRNGLERIEDYLSFDRSGLRFPLRESQRQNIWRIFEEVRYESSGIAEYDDWPAIALQELDKDEKFHGYRAVIVDEAQDCSPVMARLVLKLALGDHRRVMVLADPAQEIYANGFAQARREFAPRGAQSVVLRTPYRSTREIYALASSLYRGLPEVHRDVRELRDGSRHGPRPVVSVYGARAEADAALLTAIRGELAPGGEPARRPEEIAVLVSSNAERSRVLALLEQAGIKASFIDRSNANLDVPCVKVLTVHAAKGLDFPSVYLYRFKSPEAPTIEDRALLYVGLTRSSFSVAVICDRGTLSSLLSDIDPETYDLSGTAQGLLAV